MTRLFEVYRDYFPIGAAVNNRVLRTHGELLKKHFNSLTAENETKPFLTQPKEGVFTFDMGDEIASFAKANNMLFRGHTLVWHNCTSEWFFENLTRENGFDRIKTHIEAVMKHFNSAYLWDVVNECINDSDEGGVFRSSPWFNALGSDFLEFSFKTARSVNPSTKLFYNDYNETNKIKRERIYEVIKELNKKEKLVDGFGMQGHWSNFHPTLSEIEESIELYASLDIEIQITELDVSLFEFSDRSHIDAPTAEMLERQAEVYDDIFKIFRKYKKYITGVTFWGVSDETSWLSNFPEKDRRNWPLIFDDNQNVKNSYTKITNF